MIFEQRWYLPNSGVLPRNRVRLIEGIATTIENEWLTPQMIGRKLSEIDLVGRLGTYVSEVRLDESSAPTASIACSIVRLIIWNRRKNRIIWMLFCGRLCPERSRAFTQS